MLCKMFDVANSVASINRKIGSGGLLSYETFSVAPQAELIITLVTGQPASMVRDHISSLRLVGNSPPKRCQDPHPKDHSFQIFTNASKIGWGVHLD